MPKPIPAAVFLGSNASEQCGVTILNSDLEEFSHLRNHINNSIICLYQKNRYIQPINKLGNWEAETGVPNCKFSNCLKKG